MIKSKFKVGDRVSCSINKEIDGEDDFGTVTRIEQYDNSDNEDRFNLVKVWVLYDVDKSVLHCEEKYLTLLPSEQPTQVIPESYEKQLHLALLGCCK